jgi:acetyltransferase-like isoleucine patch superfamily enzyme
MTELESDPRFRVQHQKRLSWMPWLYFTLKPKHLVWAKPWQEEIQRHLMLQETVTLAENCFIAPEAAIFAQLGRPVQIGKGSSVAAHAFLHGPITLGENVSINARVSIDGGAAGVVIGDGCRIASGATLYAFNHQLAADRFIHEQPVSSTGIRLGVDVWVGANAGITDGVTIGDHVVVAMGAVVTRDVPAWSIVAGVPARVIGDRRQGMIPMPSVP